MDSRPWTIVLEFEPDDTEVSDARRGQGRPGRPAPALVVSDDVDARRAVDAALAGDRLVVIARADRPVLSRLYDELRRFGRVDIRTRSTRPAIALQRDELALLSLLAEGLTLGEAARDVGLSRRSADRRLASVRTRLGVRTTTEAVALLARGGNRSGRISP